MVNELNKKALEIHLDPTIIIGDMQLDDFEDWLNINHTQFDNKIIWENLLRILVNHEMYEHCAIVNKKLKE